MRASHALRLALLLSLAGCETAYQKNGFWQDGGFSEHQLSADVYQVTFEGNMYTSDARARDFLMLRCADLTLAHSGKFFRLTGASNDAQYGAVAAVSGNAVFMAPVHFPSQSATIQLRQVSEGQQDFDAAIVASSLRKQYGIK